MYISLDDFLVGLFEQVLKKEKQKTDISLDDQQIIKEFRKTLDKMSKELICRTFENEELANSMMLLPRIGRIILVFNIVLGMELSEISYLLDISLESVYTQKNKAIKKLRQNMNCDF